ATDQCRLRRHLVDPETGLADHGDPAADRHAHRPVAVTYPVLATRAGGRGGGPAIGAAAHGDRLLPVARPGPQRLDRPIHPGRRAGHPHLQFHRAGDRLGDLLHAVCGAAIAERILRHRQSSPGSGGHFAGGSLGYVFQCHPALGPPRFHHCGNPRLRPYRRRIRRGADDRRQYPRKDPGGVGADLRPCRSPGVRPGSLAGGGNAGVFISCAAGVVFQPPNPGRLEL
ncbi:Molybdenum ABC transporter permease protein ModB, partial [Pseudomonas sp. FG-3G]